MLLYVVKGSSVESGQTHLLCPSTPLAATVVTVYVVGTMVGKGDEIQTDKKTDRQTFQSDGCNQDAQTSLWSLDRKPGDTPQ